MKQPFRKNAARAHVSKPNFTLAPTGGWNVGSNIANAPPGTALVLDNAFPQPDYVRARRGTSTFSTLPAQAPVLALLPWVSGGDSKLFAASGGTVYDATASGNATATTITGTHSDRWVSVQFSPTGGATNLLAVNGVDQLIRFDGTSWHVNEPAITGIPGVIAFIWIFKSRVYLIQRDTLNAYYLDLAAIGGAAVKFELGGIFKYGGSLLCGATWSLDSQSGVFESCVFITTEGEVAMYDGPYPGADTWTLKGLYKVSTPLGKNCLMRAGGDIAIMTVDGIVPLSSVLTLDEAALQNQAITKPIAPAWKEAVTARRGLEGWQITIWPLEGLGIINLPKASQTDKVQFVSNARTGAWARYTGWDTNCFAVFNQRLFYGTSDGRVMLAEDGGSDDGQPYTMTVFPSFSTLGVTASQKIMKLVRYLLRTNLKVSPQITIRTDFDATVPMAPSANAAPVGPLWGQATWGVDQWASLPAQQQDWQHAPGFGTALSAVMQITINLSQVPDIRVVGMETLFEAGNTIG